MFNKLSSHFLEIILNMQKLHTHIYIYVSGLSSNLRINLAHLPVDPQVNMT